MALWSYNKTPALLEVHHTKVWEQETNLWRTDTAAEVFSPSLSFRGMRIYWQHTNAVLVYWHKSTGAQPNDQVAVSGCNSSGRSHVEFSGQKSVSWIMDIMKKSWKAGHLVFF